MKKLWMLTILFITGLACAIPGLNGSSDAPPSVAISKPAAGQQLAVGQQTSIESVSIDPQGVARVELLINGQVVWVDANAQPQADTPFIVAQPWTPAVPGRYVVQVRAYNTGNTAGESPALTVEVATVEGASAGATATPAPDGAISVSGATATPTPLPTATPTPTALNAPSATPLPSPSPTITLTPTPPPQTFEPTGLLPDGRFKDIWLELGSSNSRLGYPISPEITGRNYAKQFFEKGLMFWWDSPDDPDIILVLDSPSPDFSRGDTSNRYVDTWAGGEEFACNEARNGGPVRGFGKVWCQHPELQTRLGLPSEPESGSGGRAPYAHVQLFQGGSMIYNPANNQVYVVFAQGDWLRFDY